MKIAFLGDQLASFKRDHDSTWALMIEAEAQGHEVFYAHADTLVLYSAREQKANQESEAMGSEQYSVLVGAKFIKIDEQFIRNQILSDPCVTVPESVLEFADLNDFDFVFMRKDPPVDNLYVQQLRMLTLVKKAQVVNKPETLLKFNEKLSILEFPELIAPTMVSADIKQISGFLNQHKRIVLKPLDGKGGEGIFVIALGDKNFASAVEQLTNYASKPIMVQAYIPEIETAGDKRLILLDGEIAGALVRTASAGENRANMRAGGCIAPTILSSEDHKIAEALKPFCKAHGILLAGVDIIGGKLTEINITSATCLQEINRFNSKQEKIESKLIKILTSFNSALT